VTNDDSYKMMEALRRHLGINVYETDKTLEIVLTFKTSDGKVHQVCNSFRENKNGIKGS
jgi:hypothetical protein